MALLLILQISFVRCGHWNWKVHLSISDATKLQVLKLLKAVAPFFAKFEASQLRKPETTTLTLSPSQNVSSEI